MTGSSKHPRLTVRGDYVDGAWRRGRGARAITSVNPGDTRDVLGTFATGGPIAVEVAVEAARRAQPAWARIPLSRRAAAVRRIGALVERRGEELARLITREMGKALWESRQEVRRMLGRVRVTLDDGLTLIADRALSEPKGRVVHRPLGVVAVLGPFNFPANLLHGQVVPALLTGNAVVMKPSDKVPAVGQLYAEIIGAAGLPPGVFNMVQGGADVGAALAAHPQVDGVLFTGSWAAGNAIERAAVGAVARPGKLVALEMGGKNAAIVMPDADLRHAAVEIAQSAFATTGQRCSSTSRLLVHRQVADELVDRLVVIAARVAVGYGFDDGVFMGPLASLPARARFEATLRRAARDGVAEPLLPSERVEAGRPGAYLAPSLHRVRRRDYRHPYLATELFGPDLSVDLFDDLDEAIATANATDYGLCLAAFTRSRRAFDEVLRRGRAGVVNWNRGTIGGAARMPFGGLGRSGNHRPGGVDTIRSCVFPVAVREGDRDDLGALPPGFPGPGD